MVSKAALRSRRISIDRRPESDTNLKTQNLFNILGKRCHRENKKCTKKFILFYLYTSCQDTINLMFTTQ